MPSSATKDGTCSRCASTTFCDDSRRIFDLRSFTLLLFEHFHQHKDDKKKSSKKYQFLQPLIQEMLDNIFCIITY